MKGYNTILTLVSFCLLTSGYLAGQNFPITTWKYPSMTYGVLEGLSQSQVTAVHFDNHNRLWVGTKAGLNRFNGVEFENYTNNELLGLPISVTDVSSAPNGDLWMSGYGMLKKLCRDTVVDYSDLIQKLDIDPIYLTPVGDTALYFIDGHNRNFQIWSLANNQINQITTPLNDVKYLTLNYSTANNELITSQVGQGRSGVLTSISLVSYEVNSLLIMRRGYSISKSDYGHILIAANDSVFTYDNKKLNPLAELPENISSIRDLEMKEGGIFICTGTTVLQNSSFEKWDTIVNNINVANSFTVGPNDFIWIGSEEGLMKVDISRCRIFPTELGLNRGTWAGVQDSDSSILFSSYGFGLQRLTTSGYENVEINYQGQEIRNYYFSHEKLPSNSILLSHNHGVALLENDSTYNHLDAAGSKPVFGYIVNSDSSVFIFTDYLIKVPIYKTQILTDTIIKENLGYILDAEFDKDSNLWVGSFRHIAKVSNDETKFYTDSNGNSEGGVSIHVDFNDRVWFGTRYGLLTYESSTDTLLSVLRDAINEPISFVYSFNDRYLLVGGLRGIYVLDLIDGIQNIVWEKISNNLGNEGVEASQNGIFKLDNGRIVMITMTGVIEFNPTDYSIAEPSFDLDFTSYQSRPVLNKQDLVTCYLSRSDQIMLTTDSRDININYSIYSYRYLDNCTFLVELLGDEKTLIDYSEYSSIKFTQLSAGRHTLKISVIFNGRIISTAQIAIFVKASNIWNSKEWKKYGGYSFIFSVMIFIFYIFYSKNKNQIEKRQLKLIKDIQLLEIEYKLSVSQIGPHFLFNALNTISSIVSQKKSDESRKAIAKLSRILRPIFTDKREILRPIGEEITTIVDYLDLEKIRRPNKFDYKIEVSNDLSKNIKVPTLLLHSFVNNALKHGLEKRRSGGKVFMSVSKNENMIQISITDNGVGFPEDNYTINDIKGNGIRIIRQCLNWLDEVHFVDKKHTISIENQSSDNIYPGTTVYIECYANYKSTNQS